MVFAQGSAMNWTLDNNSKTEGNVGIENAVDRDENLAKIEIATLAIIFLVTVLGNGTVLLALWTRRRYAGRKKLSRMYFFILHLSIADLITAFLSVLPQLGWEVTYRFNGGFVLCKLVKYGQTLGPYLSSYVLMATAIDRHQAICYPLTYCSWTSRRSKVMVWLAWATSLAFCTPQVCSYKPSEGNVSEGHIYEDKLAALLALRLCNLNKDFHILINVKGFDKWDDIVIVLEENGIKKLYCLQLKHVTGMSNSVLRVDMFEPPASKIKGKSKTKTLYDLKKMFDGYQTIKKNLTEGTLDELFQNVDINNAQFVLFTNIIGKLEVDDKPVDEFIDILETAREKEEEQNDSNNVQNIEDEEQHEHEDEEDPHMEVNQGDYTGNEESQHVVVDAKTLNRSGSTPEEWNDFFAHFFYFGNQKGHKQLDSLIEKEIIKFLNVDAAALSSKARKYFLDYVTLWSNGKLGGHNTLTQTHIRSILVDMLMLNLESMTPPDYIGDIETGHEEWNTIVTGKSLIVLQYNDEELLRFIFDYAVRQQSIFSNSTLYKFFRNEAVDIKPLTEQLKLHNFELQCYLTKDYSSDQQFTKNFTILLFKLGLIPLVIKARSCTDMKLASKILEIIKAENRKLVLVAESLQNPLVDNNAVNSFMYLNDIESQNMSAICKKRIHIHGKEFELDKLIADTCPTLKTKLTSDNILKILIKDCQIGQKFEEEVNHIERKIPAIRLNPKVLKIKSDLFVIYGENATMRNLELIPNVSTSGCIEHDIDHKVTEETLKRRRIFLLTSANREKCYQIYHEQICALTEKNVHFIKLHILGDTTFLEWIRTRGTTEVVRNNRMASESFLKGDIESIRGNINVLSADPGYGKTTIMRQLARNQVGHLVVFISLVEHSQYFTNIDAGDHIEHLKYFFTFALEDTDLHRNVFDAFLEERKVLVIMDGMDEISKEHKDSVLFFIQNIATLKIKIWITCRVCVQEEVESKLNTLAFRLVGFSEPEKQQYLRQSSTTSIKAKSILNAEQELNEIPLYLFMLSKSPFGYSDILSLCESFIQTEISKCCAKKKLITECAQYFSKKLEDFLEQYALSKVFPNTTLAGIVRQESFEFELNFYVDAKYTSFGLIRRSNNQCSFTHKAICDYIAAKALVKLESQESMARFTTTLFDEKLDPVRFIFHKLKIKIGNTSDLKSAIIDKDYNKVEKCLENYYIEDINQDYTTSLHLAAQWGTRHYFPTESNIVGIDEKSCRKANENGTERIVELLLRIRKIKKIIFQKDKLLSWTPINYADRSRSLGIFDQFAKIDTFDLNSSEMLTNISKSVLLYFCIRFHYNNLFEILCDHPDIDWNLKCTDSGNSFLHCACVYGNTYALDFLLKKLPKNGINKKGETPLHVAAYGFKHVVSLLLSIGPDLEATDSEGYTPLHRTVRCGQREIAELLIGCGADTMTTSFQGYSLLHTASYIDQAELLLLLIANGADYNITDNEGNSPLHTAIEWNSMNCVKILAKNTTNINSRNKLGRTPLDLAVRNEQLDMVKQLKSRGAEVLDVSLEMSDPIRTYLEPLIKNYQPKDFISRSETVTLANDFDVKMVALLSFRCCESNIEEMVISTDVEECGLFGDIFLHINSEKSGNISYLIQLKHQSEPRDITLSEFQYAKGNYRLSEYTEEIKNIINPPEAKKSNVIYNLKNSNKVIFILFTNRTLSEDTFTFLENIDDQPLFLNVIETGGTVYKLNLVEQSFANMYLFTKQTNYSQIDDLLINTIQKLLPALQLSSHALEKAIRAYTTFVGKWIEGRLGGHHFLTKNLAVNILTDVLLSPYMILHNYNTVDLQSCTKHNDISNVISSMEPLTVLNSSENYGSYMCQEIVRQLSKRYVNLPVTIPWTNPFSNEMQIAFYENNHSVKSDLVRMVGYAGKITLLDIYKCTWMLGNIPLVLEVTSLQDFENIRAIHNLSQERLKLVLINCTNEQLLYEH